MASGVPYVLAGDALGGELWSRLLCVETDPFLGRRGVSEIGCDADTPVGADEDDEFDDDE